MCQIEQWYSVTLVLYVYQNHDCVLWCSPYQIMFSKNSSELFVSSLSSRQHLLHILGRHLFPLDI